MIKNWKQFIVENKSESETIGEYVEKLSLQHDWVIDLVTPLIKNVKPWVKLSSAIDSLDDMERLEVLKRVENHLNSDSKVSVSSNVNLGKIDESYGKGVMTTFFKCLTALGLKDNSQEEVDIPQEFIIFFKFKNLDNNLVKNVFKRFKSLSHIEMDDFKNLGLYFGITTSGYFEYGYYHDELSPIGTFKLNKSSVNSFKTSELKSISGLKKSIMNLSYNDLLLLGRIKTEMVNFNPGFFKSKSAPVIKDRVISFGYMGLGRWDNGNFNQEDHESMKMKIKEYLSNFKWSDRILVSISWNNFWVYVNIKLK